MEGILREQRINLYYNSTRRHRRQGKKGGLGGRNSILQCAVNNNSLSLSRRIRSFAHAFRGIGILLKSQPNAWLHLAAMAAVLALGLYVGLTAIEWAIIALAIIAVLAAEGFNTAIEFLSDAVTTEYHPLVKKVKDVAAGAVLITAIGAAVVGLLIFVPHIAALYRG